MVRPKFVKAAVKDGEVVRDFPTEVINPVSYTHLDVYKRQQLNGSPLKYARHPLVYLVEAADDICYQMMDIEDAHVPLLYNTETRPDY